MHKILFICLKAYFLTLKVSIKEVPVLYFLTIFPLKDSTFCTHTWTNMSTHTWLKWPPPPTSSWVIRDQTIMTRQLYPNHVHDYIVHVVYIKLLYMYIYMYVCKSQQIDYFRIWQQDYQLFNCTCVCIQTVYKFTWSIYLDNLAYQTLN